MLSVVLQGGENAVELVATTNATIREVHKRALFRVLTIETASPNSIPVRKMCFWLPEKLFCITAVL